MLYLKPIQFPQVCCIYVVALGQCRACNSSQSSDIFRPNSAFVWSNHIWPDKFIIHYQWGSHRVYKRKANVLTIFSPCHKHCNVHTCSWDAFICIPLFSNVTDLYPCGFLLCTQINKQPLIKHEVVLMHANTYMKAL